MLTFAQVLEAHGYSDEAQSVLERAIEWFEDRPAEEAASRGHRVNLGWAQLVAGRYEEARRIFDSLVERYPDDMNSRAYRGLVAALDGDSTQALEDLEWLNQTQDRYQRYRRTSRRAAINGAMGRLDDAVDLLWSAFGEGMNYEPQLWYNADFGPLRDHPNFQEWLRPKG